MRGCPPGTVHGRLAGQAVKWWRRPPSMGGRRHGAAESWPWHAARLHPALGCAGCGSVVHGMAESQRERPRCPLDRGTPACRGPGPSCPRPGVQGGGPGGAGWGPGEAGPGGPPPQRRQADASQVPAALAPPWRCGGWRCWRRRSRRSGCAGLPAPRGGGAGRAVFGRRQGVRGCGAPLRSAGAAEDREAGVGWAPAACPGGDAVPQRGGGQAGAHPPRTGCQAGCLVNAARARTPRSAGGGCHAPTTPERGDTPPGYANDGSAVGWGGGQVGGGRADARPQHRGGWG